MEFKIKVTVTCEISLDTRECGDRTPNAIAHNYQEQANTHIDQEEGMYNLMMGEGENQHFIVEVLDDG